MSFKKEADGSGRFNYANILEGLGALLHYSSTEEAIV